MRKTIVVGMECIKSTVEKISFFVKGLSGVTKALGSFLLVITVVVLLFRYTGMRIDELFLTWRSISGQSILFVLGATYLFIFVIALRWRLLVTAFIPDGRFCPGFFFYYSSMSLLALYFVSQTFGNLGVKTLSLKLSQNMKLFNSAITVALEHLANLLVLAVMVLPSFLYVFHLASPVVLLGLNFAVLVVLVLLVFFRFQLVLAIIERLGRWVGSLMGKVGIPDKYAGIFSNTVSGCADFDRWVAVKVVLISIAVYYMCLFRSVVYAEALGINVPIIPLMLLFPFVYVMSAVGVTPGSIGVTELGWVGMLVFIGVSKGDAGIFVVSMRMFNISSAIIWSMVSHFVYSYFVTQKSEEITR